MRKPSLAWNEEGRVMADTITTKLPAGWRSRITHAATLRHLPQAQWIREAIVEKLEKEATP